MTKMRITVDSVIDKKYVRVLISTDGKTEKPVIMEKSALKKLLQEKKLKRKIESEVFSIEDRGRSFTNFSTSVGRRTIRTRDISTSLGRLKKPVAVTAKKRSGIRKRQRKIRERMGGT